MDTYVIAQISVINHKSMNDPKTLSRDSQTANSW